MSWIYGFDNFARSYLRFIVYCILGSLCAVPPVLAEYADIVLNNRSDKEGVNPVIFPHWFHRIRFRCKVCHADLGFKMEAGGNQINMLKIIDGEYCGACHNGEVAWTVENCDLCHSGVPGTQTGITGAHETLGPGSW